MASRCRDRAKRGSSVLRQVAGIDECIQKIVDGHEAYAPDAFETSLEELMPEYKRAANAVVARLGIMAQIKVGKMQFSVDGPDQATD